MMRLLVLSSVAAFALTTVACGGSTASDSATAGGDSDLSSKGTAFSCTAYRSDEDNITVSLRFQNKSDATKLSSVAISLGTEADGIVADYSVKSASSEDSVLNLLESTDKSQNLEWDEKPLDLTKYNCFDVSQKSKNAVAKIFLCLNKDDGTKSPNAFVVTNYWADANKPGKYDEFACVK